MSEESPELGAEAHHTSEERDMTDTSAVTDEDDHTTSVVPATGVNPGPGIEDDDDKGQTEEEESGDEDEDDEDGEEEEEDEEPKLKYARLTQHLAAVYRNGDMTSAFLVGGDKMIVGTHDGNIHVIQLPMFQTLTAYHIHSASVTALSISPFPPPVTTLKPEQITKLAAEASPVRPASRQSENSPASARKPRQPQAPPIPNIPSNNLYIASSAVDGNVFVRSLVDIKDVAIRNFGRPVQAVALSPDYKNDKTYLSGGLAGQLVLTVGAPQGRSTSTTVGTAAATASGWLGSVGLGHNTGKDTVLHSGEGTISTIKWSMSGRYVAWLNEQGIKIMRSKHRLESADAEDAWKRIGHIDRPQTEEWDTMAAVWKGRAEWIDETAVETPEEETPAPTELGISSPAAEKLKQQQTKSAKKVEKLIVGWGGTIWIIHVHPGGIGTGKHIGERSIGRAEIVKK